MISPGQQIGGYTVLHLLGRGGMGEVYLAQHRRVARRAAIKVLIPELSQNAVVLDRFFNEARSASLIRHPGIVEILDCDLYLGQAYIVMEFLEGESFGGYLFRTGPMSSDLPFFFGVAAAVSSAVGAAHATGIIHRDLKPDNVFLHLPGTTNATIAVKILDFGIAKLAQQEGATSKTGTGVLLGTPAYMSPEQCRGAGRVDSRSDIYSLGCIYYEAITGWPPFVREGFGELIVAHVSEAPIPPRDRVPALPADLDDLIVRMLAKEPEHRPQTMDDVTNALRACARAAGLDPDAPLRAKVPVERSTTNVGSTSTEAAPAGSSAGATAPLGPPSGPTPAREAPRDRSASRAPSPSGDGQGQGERSGVVSPVEGARSASTRILGEAAMDDAEPRRKTTTFGSTAAEKLPRPPRRVGPGAMLAGGAIAAIAVVVAIFAARPTAPPAATNARRAEDAVEPARTRGSASNVTGAATVAGSPAPSAPTAAAAPSAAPPSVPSPSGASPERSATTAREDTVRIDVRGAPSDTTAVVDGHAAQFPVTLPRGPAVHRITLTAPGESPRSIEVDGTRDRIVDLVLTKIRGGDRGGDRSAVPPAEHASRDVTDQNAPHRPAATSHDRARASARASDRKPSSGSSDREAITDL